MSDHSKDLSGVPTLSSDNYPIWRRKINAYLRFNDLYRIVHGEELRPGDTDREGQTDWDKRASRAAGAIEMTLDDKSSTHIEGLEGNATQMWQKLDKVHNNKTPGTRFNAMDAMFNIQMEETENLGELITRIKAAMLRVKALRPVSPPPSITVTSASGTSAPLPSSTGNIYTIETLDDELVIMTLLRALPDSYNHLRSALLIQPTLTLEVVEKRFPR
ncbi:hypothetical protein M408DRAFT_320982 [Serendipita vermifera MAFF 305830]|uniref:DUF4219 domain-containing protein n=1 Tax=Serendipita vermifera MAFF 305830 TaxID=933852 RepID=A0A0C3AFJ3_SERVB|nr:hypothetical protein M408DRAFT_320982 [Serendipita vermifera MAFF 305830]